MAPACLRLDKILERSFFIKDMKIRRSTEHLCTIGLRQALQTIEDVKQKLSCPEGDEHEAFFRNVLNGEYDDLFEQIEQRELWSEVVFS
tara:strand:- start:1066 stop:1332 length:267 start_codon:yes stop_codon:yes gene_type:complete